MQDAGHLARRSGVAVVIEAAAIPLSDPARRLVDSSPGLRHDVLTGGDDYELLFAAPPSCRDAVIEAAAGADTAVKRIGRVEAGRGVRVLDPDGRAVDGLDRGGWDHF